MGQAELQTRRYTPEEYFALEERSKVRHEYVDGEVFAMAGGSKTHNVLIQNATSKIRVALRGKGCEIFSSDVRLEAKERFYYTYPDIVVTCDPADHLDPYSVRHPVIIAEVQSPSTSEYDRSTKFENYQKLPSLRHYLLISQVAWTVEWFRRDEAGQWIYTLLNGPDATLEIPDMGLVLPLHELYEDTSVAPLRVRPGVAEDEPGRLGPGAG
jgi:Uma2 family endonuclease